MTAHTSTGKIRVATGSIYDATEVVLTTSQEQPKYRYVLFEGLSCPATKTGEDIVYTGSWDLPFDPSI